MAETFTQNDRFLGTSGADAAGKKGFALQVTGAGDIPVGATPLNVSSGNVANASAAALLGATATTTTYISGFEITAGGATVGALVSATVSGLAGGTMTYTFAAPTGATAGATPLVVQFSPAQPASAINTAITVTLPALGAGNTNAAVSAHGYRI